MNVPEDSFQFLQAICQAIFDKKGCNILTLDVRGISSITDYFIIAEGNVDRHVFALYMFLFDKLALLDRKPVHIEGDEGGGWIVIDYGDIMIHLMTSEMREKYMFEQVWKEGLVVDIPFHTNS